MKPLSHGGQTRVRNPAVFQRGAVAVELAFVTIVMLMMAAGIVEFGRVFWYYNALDKATRDAARYMSALPVTDVTNGTTIAADVSTAANLVVGAANGARVTPALTTANVSIVCDAGACNGTKPGNVTVSITGFDVSIGAWFPLIVHPGNGFASVPLAPSTTMRYMN